MARQYSIDFDWIKRHADFRAVLAHYGIAAIGQAEQVRICCPFHDDRNPSCSVNWKDNLFSCKAASCEREGNIIQFVQWLESDRGGAALSTRDAAKLVAAWSGIETRPPQASQGVQKRRKRLETTKESSGADRPSTGPKSAPAGRPEHSIDAESTAKWLERNPLNREHHYLQGRIGPGGMALWKPCGFVAKGKLAGYAMLPVRDLDGQVVAMIGRWADDEVPEGKEKYRFPPNFEKSTHLFGLYELGDLTTRQWLVLVEGLFDAIRLQDLGYPAVALLGSSLSDAQLDLLREHCPALRLVLVLMDGDKGGHDAADRMAPKLGRHYSMRIIDLPEDTDPETASDESLTPLIPGSARARAA